MVVPSQTLSTAIEHYNAGNLSSRNSSRPICSPPILRIVTPGDCSGADFSTNQQSRPRPRLSQPVRCNAICRTQLLGKLSETFIARRATRPRRFATISRRFASALTLPTRTMHWAASTGTSRIGQKLPLPSKPRLSLSPTIRKSPFIWPTSFSIARARTSTYFRQTLQQTPLHPIASTRLGIALAEQGYFEERSSTCAPRSRTAQSAERVLFPKSFGGGRVLRTDRGGTQTNSRSPAMTRFPQRRTAIVRSPWRRFAKSRARTTPPCISFMSPMDSKKQVLRSRTSFSTAAAMKP